MPVKKRRFMLTSVGILLTILGALGGIYAVFVV
jgi:hypothetical protein